MNKQSLQNIYDNPDFFAGYAELRQNESGFNALLEQPAICSLLPKLKDSAVIDLGCGFGDLCRYVRAQGARSVIGVDLSKNMLEVAQQKTNDTAIEYCNNSIEEFTAEANSADLVISSLAIHYVADYEAIIKKIYAWLKPAGRLIFSVEHPVCTAHPTTGTVETTKGDVVWPVVNYRDEGQFKQTWFVDNVIKYHRTMQTYVNTLIEAGFTLDKLLEPMPSDAMIAHNPNFAIHKVRPPLLVVSAYKAN